MANYIWQHVRHTRYRLVNLDKPEDTDILSLNMVVSIAIPGVDLDYIRTLQMLYGYDPLDGINYMHTPIDTPY